MVQPRGRLKYGGARYGFNSLTWFTKLPTTRYRMSWVMEPQQEI